MLTGLTIGCAGLNRRQSSDPATSPAPPATAPPAGHTAWTAPEATPTLLAPVGHIEVRWGVGDAGNFFLYPTASVSFRWRNPPAWCSRYEFILTGPDNSSTVIGVDTDPLDGVSLDWVVPSFESSRLIGIAECGEGSRVPSEWGSDLHAADPPPAGVCTLASGSIAALDILPATSSAAEPIGELAPGTYARLLARDLEGWYQIEAPENPDAGTPAVDGWIAPEAPVVLLGPCDSLPGIADG